MSKKDLQIDIRDNEGLTLSDGTLNPAHLLARAYDTLLIYKINPKLRKEIRKLFIIIGWKDGDDIWTHMYHGRTILKNSEVGDFWEDIYDYFNEITPSGYYFGSLEGDGACIGWFQIEDEH